MPDTTIISIMFLITSYMFLRSTHQALFTTSANTARCNEIVSWQLFCVIILYIGLVMRLWAREGEKGIYGTDYARFRLLLTLYGNSR